MNMKTNQGWQCPVCKRVHSPVMIECSHCNNPNTGSAAKDGYAMIDFKAKLANDLIKMDIDSLKDFTVDLPLLYPRCGWVSIKIKWNDDSFYVCDNGRAWLEAIAISAMYLFEEHAKEAARKYGVDADSRHIFCAKTTKEELFSKIVQIANASIFCAKNVSDAQDKRNREVRAALEPKQCADTDFIALEIELKEKLPDISIQEGYCMEDSSNYGFSGFFPVKYPNGVEDSIGFINHGFNFSIDDNGVAENAAEKMKVLDIYEEYAKKSAIKYGLGFDNGSMYKYDIPADELVDAILNFENASKYVVELLMEEAEKRSTTEPTKEKK